MHTLIHKRLKLLSKLICHRGLKPEDRFIPDRNKWLPLFSLKHHTICSRIHVRDLWVEPDGDESPRRRRPSPDYCSPLLAYCRTWGGVKGRSSCKETTKAMKHVCNNTDNNTCTRTGSCTPPMLQVKTYWRRSNCDRMSEATEAPGQRKMCSPAGDKLIHQSASVWQVGFQVKSSAKSERAGETGKQWRKTRRQRWEQWGDNCREGGRGDAALSGCRFGKASSTCHGL